MVVLFLIVLAALPVAAVESEPVSSLAEAFAIPSAANTPSRPFDMEVIVLQKPIPGKITFQVKNGNLGWPVDNYTSVTNLQVGDRIRIRGDFTVSPERQFFFHVNEIDIIGHEKIARPHDATVAEIATGKHDFTFVNIRGTVTAAFADDLDPDYNWITVRTETGAILMPFSTKSFSLAQLRKFLDTEIEVSGMVSYTCGFRHQLAHCISCSAADVKILRPPPDPFKAEEFGEGLSPHRRQASGLVIARSFDRFYLLNGTGRLITVYPVRESSPPVCGEGVTASGFIGHDPFRLCLREAVLRPCETCVTMPEPTPISLEMLFKRTDGETYVLTGRHGRLVTLDGNVLAFTDNGRHVTEMLLDCDGHALSIDISGLSLKYDDLPAKCSAVRINALCIAHFTKPEDDVLFPVFERFTFIPRTPSDLLVLSNPPWWTPARLFFAILALIVVIIAFTVWNISIKHIAEKRGRALYSEKITSAIAEQKVEERTRLAVEIHDSISQTLTGIALQLDAADEMNGAGRSPGTFLEKARQMLASCRRELRNCLWDLRSRTFEEKDMNEAVNRTLAPHVENIRLSVRFNVPRETLSESTVHAILKIIRELSANAIRHGMATELKIAGEYHGGDISFSVTDNGLGFDPLTVPGAGEGHFGLLGIRERLEEFNGSMKILSKNGTGTKVSVYMHVGKPEL